MAHTHTPKGFTLVELILSIAIFSIALTAVSAVYIQGQKATVSASIGAELRQNARVAMDRLSRELRQARVIVTTLPATTETAVDEVVFQNGHDTTTDTSYIRYFLDGTNLRRQVIHYSFPSEASVYVPYNSRDIFDNAPDAAVQADELVGEFFDELRFWGVSPLVQVEVLLSNESHTLPLQTAVYGRNL